MKRLAVLLLLTACSSGSTAPPVGGVSKADYVKQAEAVCAVANKDQNALVTPTSVDGLAPYVSRIVAIAEKATTELKAIEAPKADQADLQEKVLGPLSAQLVVGQAYADKVAAAAKTKDNAALVQLLTNAPTQTKADLRWMKGYGFKECVEAADTSG